jgi:hypothetical protein
MSVYHECKMILKRHGGRFSEAGWLMADDDYLGIVFWFYSAIFQKIGLRLGGKHENTALLCR